MKGRTGRILVAGTIALALVGYEGAQVGVAQEMNTGSEKSSVGWFLPEAPRSSPGARPTRRSRPRAAVAIQQLISTRGGPIPELGLPDSGIALIGAQGSGVRMIFPPGQPEYAKLNASGDLVAYVDWLPYSPKRGRLPRVVVVDDTCRILATFANSTDFAWQPNGPYLALPFQHLIERDNATTDSVGIWDSRSGRLRVVNVPATAIRWGERDSLFLQVGDHVEVVTGRVGRHTRVDATVADDSPDRRFGLFGESRTSRHEVRDHEQQIRLGNCIGFVGLRLDTWFNPFWVWGGNNRHALCALGAVDLQGSAKAGQWFGVVDVDRLELLAKVQGEAIEATTDRRGVVVLRGDSVLVVELSGVTEAPPRKLATKIRVTTSGDTYGQTRSYMVGAGEWVPIPGIFVAPCPKYFRVRRVLRNGTATLECFYPLFAGAADSVMVGREPVRLSVAGLKDAELRVELKVE